ncbi:unnamed protein product, partial [Didymodactylos carnosus]
SMKEKIMNVKKSIESASIQRKIDLCPDLISLCNNVSYCQCQEKFDAMLTLIETYCYSLKDPETAIKLVKQMKNDVKTEMNNSTHEEQTTIEKRMNSMEHVFNEIEKNLDNCLKIKEAEQKSRKSDDFEELTLQADAYPYHDESQGEEDIKLGMGMYDNYSSDEDMDMFSAKSTVLSRASTTPTQQQEIEQVSKSETKFMACPYDGEEFSMGFDFDGTGFALDNVDYDSLQVFPEKSPVLSGDIITDAQQQQEQQQVEQHVSTSIARLKELARDMEYEIQNQNAQIDRLAAKTDNRQEMKKQREYTNMMCNLLDGDGDVGGSSSTKSNSKEILLALRTSDDAFEPHLCIATSTTFSLALKELSSPKRKIINKLDKAAEY